MKITFLGAVGTVTGSKYLLEAADKKILLDCGLFQGFKQLRLRNWAPLPVDPKTVDAVILTHAHLDHSGYLPLLVKNGFSGPIYATAATRDLGELLLLDSGFLHEHEADFANRHGFSKHKPAKPLYTQRDAKKAVERFKIADYGPKHDLGGGISFTYHQAGHILGSAIVRVSSGNGSIVFSGDLGRPDNPIMYDPDTIRSADYLVVESTYGDRLHDRTDPEDALADIISTTAGRGGSVIIPAFAVGRSQTVLYHLHRLKQAGRIPDLPVFLDSPMAIHASEVFCKHAVDHRLSAAECRATCNVATYVREAEDSKALDQNHVPMVLISASGMATGGRILHHLKHFLPDSRNTILFTGFQAGGTRGASLTGGARRVKIHGEYFEVRAQVENLHMLSAHADQDEIMGWLGHFDGPPRMTFVTHGEPPASDALRHRIEEELRWPSTVPEFRDEFDLKL